MKSEIWDNESTVKAFTTGYDLKNIDLFDEQCEKLLRAVLFENSLIDKKFSDSIDNLEKANFLILNENTSSLYDCLRNIKIGNVRIAARVFRDTLENMHILELLNNSGNNKYLNLWYSNEVISHGDYRDWIKKTNSELSELTRVIYRLYSKYAHRTYKTILENYEIENGFLKFNYHLDRTEEYHRKLLSRYYSHLSYFVLKTTLNYRDYNVHSITAMSRIAEDWL
jgi:hypothetical protein